MRKRIGWGIVAGLAILMTLTGRVEKPEALGLAYRAEIRAENVRLLVDETWVDAEGTRQTSQEIFDSIFEMIDQAERFVLIDLFLMNDFGFKPGEGLRPMSRELADHIVAKRAARPDVEIIFISDPVNTVYGSIASPLFADMEAAGARVVLTDLDQLRDSNPIYSKPWRLFVKPFGVGPGDALGNPMGEGRVSIRSLLKLMNIKANHRKVVITEKSILLTSANPHSASSAHWNVALRVDGAGVREAVEMESAVLNFSDPDSSWPPLRASDSASDNGHALELLTEIRIKEKVLDLLESAAPGARVDLCMFYLSQKDVIQGLIAAKKRGVDVRVILDAARDSFNVEKNGVPNRQSAAKLVKAGIPLRWANTHGEQCHVKMLYVENPAGDATLLLGSCNYTRRNMDNFNCEANAAYTAPLEEPSLVRARETFDRWWSNEEGKTFTVDYDVFRDDSALRRFSAWWGETTGMSVY